MFVSQNIVVLKDETWFPQWCQASQANGQTQMFWPLRFAKVFHDEGHCRVENHLSDMTWNRLISTSQLVKMQRWRKHLETEIKWCFGFPIYHDLDWLLNMIHWHPWLTIRNIWGPDRCSCSQKDACQQLHRKTIGDAHDSETRQGHQDPDLQNSFGAILINAKASWYP